MLHQFTGYYIMIFGRPHEVLKIFKYQIYCKNHINWYMWHAQSLQLCLTLCNTTDCSPPDSPVHELFQARILEWVAMPSCRGSSQIRDQSHVSPVSCTAGQFLTTEPLGKPNICGNNLKTNKLFLYKFDFSYHPKTTYQIMALCRKQC